MTLPYFRFFPGTWITGDIYFEDYNTKGMFIDLCANYWLRGCDLSVEDCKKRCVNIDLILLEKLKFISIKKEKIHIDFLDEEYERLSKTHDSKREAGRRGGLSKAKAQLQQNRSTATAQLKHSSSILDIELELELDKEKENKEKEIFPSSPKSELISEKKEIPPKIPRRPPQEKKIEIISKVLLSETEIEKLKLTFGTDFSAALEKLSNYKNSSGKVYKSDYHALIGWVKDFFNKKKIDKNGKQEFADAASSY